MKMISLMFALSVVTMTAQQSIELSKGTTVNFRTVTASVDNPWQLAVEPGGYLWCTDRDNGHVVRIHPGLGWTDVVLDVSLTSRTDDPAIAGGLYGIAIHPQFDAGMPYVFITYTTADDRLVVARYTYNGQKLVDGRKLLTVDDVPHTMGQTLTVLADNTLLVSVASFDTPAPTELSKFNGKLVRLNLDGTAPTNNPWYNWQNPSSVESFIYTLGHRNVSGIAQLPATHPTSPGAIYAVESGPIANDEINLIQPGSDYGWRKISGYCEQDKTSLQCPLSTYFQAPTQVAYYNSRAIPEWRNSLLVGTTYGNGLMVASLNSSGLIDNSDPSKSAENTMVLDDDHLIPFVKDAFPERLRSVVSSFDGRVYVIASTYDKTWSSRIVALENPAAHTPLAVNEDVRVGNGFSFGPNPAKEVVTVQLNTAPSSVWTLELIDVMGRRIEMQQHERYETSATVQSDRLAAGAYQLVITSNDGKLRSTLIK